MLVVRPISMSDYRSLYRCAVESGHGFTSLPVNEELLKNRIYHSEASFAKTDINEPNDEGYLLVGVDSQTDQVVGTTAIEASVGWDRPFYSYYLSKHIHASQRLGVRKTVQLLTLDNSYTGSTELCTLFLLPEHRQGTNGRLMSKSRFMLLAEHPARFSTRVIAEMRGVSDAEGNSPFWQWLQKHFFDIDFTLADYLSGIGRKGFIADLMPKMPIYVNLLSEEAQAVIGQVHENTKPALRLLEKEGFACRGYVDIFDGGPMVECDLSHIHSVQHSVRAEVKIGKPQTRENILISNTSFDQFRATMINGDYDKQSATVTISLPVAEALLLEHGDQARLLPS